ncbi:MAG: radical SAM protein [Planctomycetota bacterium]
MSQTKQYLFGPVPSRRLGLSLGIDCVPLKVCTLDCVYCQLGRSSDKTVFRKDYVPIDQVIEQLRHKIDTGLHADYITLSGSGEPTLNSRIADLIRSIKSVTNINIAILTNGTLFNDPAVRADCVEADLVLPSLDAGNQAAFQRINRPHNTIILENLIQGLCDFRTEFAGRIWLEVFLIEGYNTDNAQIDDIKTAIDRIRPDKVQLNTAVRPTTEPGIKPLDPEKLRQIARRLGPNAEVIADFAAARHNLPNKPQQADILEMLRRRPCSIEDISAALAIHPTQVAKEIQLLAKNHLITQKKTGSRTFFAAK